MNQKTFILIGRSGCGKGTQSKVLSEAMAKAGQEVLYIQSGAEFREFIKGDSATAQLSAKAYAGGILQPEFLAVHMWIGALVRGYNGKQSIIFDGTPRKFHEAGVLDSVFEFYGLDKPYVINIDISAKWATERLLGRHRMDDTRGDIESRMKWYETDVAPTIAFYEKSPNYNFIRINGERSIAEVSADILKAVGM